jgi:predicted O-methyltransferase YrrM|uniref:Methyltransferase n=1 Tax=viral metagenome TaxID=1070528 RepID=A0A6C0CWL7_9ZZZZ
MNSSYINSVEYKDIFDTILYLNKPKNILEIGILDGYSLELFAKYNTNTKIKAYDIFEEFNGNHPDKEKLLTYFKDYTNVSINYGNFYELYNTLNSTYDIIHIDIANNGDVYEYAIENYLSKLNNNGILLLEGGSKERDRVEWMKKYSKPQIQPVLCKYKNDYNILTIGTVPSVTLIQKKI